MGVYKLKKSSWKMMGMTEMLKLGWLQSWLTQDKYLDLKLINKSCLNFKAVEWLPTHQKGFSIKISI